MINKDGNQDEEINERIAVTGRIFNGIKSTFLSKQEIPAEVKVKGVRKVSKPNLTYACAS